MAKQDYIDHVVGSLPKWFIANPRVMENISAFADIFARAETQSEFFQQMTFIEEATAGPPDWLSQHAVDRASLRQAGETDVALRARIKGSPDTLTLATLLAAAQAIVDGAGIVGNAAILELRPDKAYFAENTVESGTQGKFTGTAPDMLFTLSTLATFQSVPPRDTTVASMEITFSGSADAGNDGTFVITGYTNDGITYTNPTGVVALDVVTAWALAQKDSAGNVLGSRRRAYFDRGHRMGSGNTLIIMLPFGCTTTVVDAVIEALRLIRGAGTKIIVECRQ